MAQRALVLYCIRRVASYSLLVFVMAGYLGRDCKHKVEETVVAEQEQVVADGGGAAEPGPKCQCCPILFVGKFSL